ncbi:MAG: LytR/AlgR family response regulator transcription factor [Alphaproteobacteria bacterium]
MSGRLRAFLVDDEPLALRALARLLKATGRVELVGTATDPEAALATLAAEPVDVLFLDIRMPGMSGFELLERLPASPLVVFTTGYNRYAVQAFEVNAVDYLVKPVERERLDRTLDRLERLRDDPQRGEFRGVMERLASYLRAGPERLALRAGERVHFIELAGVTHFVARDRQTYAVTATGEHLLDFTIAQLERRLDPARFVRIHRATLVNLAWVDEVHPGVGEGLLIRLKDGTRTELVVSRDRVREVKDRLGL